MRLRRRLRGAADADRERAIGVNPFDGSDGAVNAVTFSMQLGEDLLGVHSLARW